MARTQEIVVTMRALKRKASEEPAVAAEPRQAAEVQKHQQNKAGVAGLCALRIRALAKRRKNRVPRRSREGEPSLGLPDVPQSMPKIIARLQQDEREELVRFISGFGDIFNRLGQRDEQKTEALGRLEAEVAEMAARCRSDELFHCKQRELVKRLKELHSRLKKQNRQLKEMMNEGFSSRDERISELANELAKEQDDILRLNDLLDKEEEKSKQLELQLKSEKLKSTYQELKNRDDLAELEYQKHKNEKLLAELKLLAEMK